MMDTITEQLSLLTAFCQSYPKLIAHLGEFPKLYEFARKYPALVSQADEAMEVYETMQGFRACGVNKDEVAGLVKLAQALMLEPEGPEASEVTAEAVEAEAEVDTEADEAEDSAQPKPERQALTEEDKAKLHELVEERGYSRAQIGRLVGAADYTIRDILAGRIKTVPTGAAEKLRQLDIENMPEGPSRRVSKSEAQETDEAPEEPA